MVGRAVRGVNAAAASKGPPSTIARLTRQTVLELERTDSLAAACRELGLETGRPVLVVVGGADGLSEQLLLECTTCADGLIAAAEATGAAIVDGGTDSGVMRLLGHAHARARSSVPLVGVVTRALAARPGEPAAEGSAPLEPNHTHVLLVPGEHWGDEAPWITRLAGLIADGRPSVTVLVNGGEVSWTDVAESVAAGRPVLVVAGTGRTADRLAEAVAGSRADERATTLVGSGLVESVGLGEDARPSLQERVEQLVGTRRANDDDH